MSASKRILLGSVSSIALAISAPAVMAADVPTPTPMYTNAPPPAPQNQWTAWVEGGAQGLIGDDPYVAGFSPGFFAPPRSWGWNGAVGFDYRFNAEWHISGDFRYGAAKSRSRSSNPIATFGIPTISGATSAAAIAGTNSATRNEHHWVADFMVGRDIGLGSGNSQLKIGVRVAEIRGKTVGSSSWNVPTGVPVGVPTGVPVGVPTGTATTAAIITPPAAIITPPAAVITHTRSYVQTNRFLGVGPRLALESSVPIGGPWSLEYMGGVAALYGVSMFNQTITASGAASCLSGCPVNLSSSSDEFVFNPDAMLGLSYEFMPNAKLSLNYRIDAYIAAMKVVDGSGKLQNSDRIYHGPNLRLTFDF